MFGKRDIDDFDDYKREQAEINREKSSENSSGNTWGAGKKDKGVHKLPKLHKIINAAGNPVYTKVHSPEKIIIAALVLFFPIVMISMMVNVAGAEFGAVSAQMFVPLIFFFSFFAIFYFAIFGLAPKAKRVEVTDNSIICKLSFTNNFEIPLSSFIELECRRTYTKNHQYSGTIYYIVYKDPNTSKDRKIKFPSNEFLDASDFNYEVSKRLWDTNAQDSNEEFIESKQFLIPQRNSFNAEQMTFFMIFPVIIFIMIMFVFGMRTSRMGIGNTQLPFVIVFFVFLAFFVILSTLKMQKRKWDKLPEVITFERDGIRVDDKYFRSNEVKRIYITPIGRNNPRAFDNSTIDIITENARYSYNLGLFFYGRRHYMSGSDVMPQWTFDTFYYCASKWCGTNKIEMVDFLI